MYVRKNEGWSCGPQNELIIQQIILFFNGYHFISCILSLYLLKIACTYIIETNKLLYKCKFLSIYGYLNPIVCFSIAQFGYQKKKHNYKKYVLWSSGIIRKLGALIMKYMYSQKKEWISIVFYCFEHPPIAHNFGTFPIQLGFSAKCTSSN